MKLTGLNHVGIRALDRQRSERFYVDLLGLVPHPTKTNWLMTADGEYSLHLMPGTTKSDPGNDLADAARHIALETDDLETVVDDLLAAGLAPFQSTVTYEETRTLTDSSDLSFGIGTVFVTDPDDNIVEFIDRRRGLFAQVLGTA